MFFLCPALINLLIKNRGILRARLTIDILTASGRVPLITHRLIILLISRIIELASLSVWSDNRGLLNTRIGVPDEALVSSFSIESSSSSEKKDELSSLSIDS